METSFLVALCIAGFVGGIVALVAIVRSLLRLLRESLECVVPLAERQRVTFGTPGRKGLHVEGPRFTTAFAGLSFAMRDEATGREVPTRIVLFRTVTSGLSQVRMLVRHVTIPHAGAYELSVLGMKEGRDYADCRVAFLRPHLARSVLAVVGLIAAGGVTITSLVFGILAMTHSL